jgi:hypothetical protein
MKVVHPLMLSELTSAFGVEQAVSLIGGQITDEACGLPLSALQDLVSRHIAELAN